MTRQGFTDSGSRSARLLYAADFLLDAHTAGLEGLSEALWSEWSEGRYTAARRVFDVAIEQSVDGLLLSGRLLGEAFGGSDPAGDGWNFRSAAFLTDQVRRLSEFGIPAVWHGSADQSPSYWPEFLGRPVGLTFLRGDGGGRHEIAGLSVSAASRDDVTLGQDSVALFGTEVPAAPPQSLGDAGPFGATLLTVSAGDVRSEHIDCDAVRFHDRTIDATDGSRWDQLEKSMRSHVRQLQDEPGPSAFHVLRWTVRGHGPAWSRLHAPGPRGDLMRALRSLTDEGAIPVFAESVTPEADEAQVSRWADGDGRASTFAAAVVKTTGRPLDHPDTASVIAVATTLAH